MANQCFFSKNDCCSNTFIHLYDIRYEKFEKRLFPDAQSCIEIMLLRSDLFYQTKFRLRKTLVCSKHKEELLREYRRSKYRSCFVCVRGFKKLSANNAAQNIDPTVALTLYEHFGLQRSYGMPICRRCREEILKRCDKVSILFLLLKLKTCFFYKRRIDEHESAFLWLENVVFSDEESDESSDETDYHPSPISAISTLSSSPGQKCIHKLIQDLVRSYPYKIFRTILSKDQTISYSLNFLMIQSDSDYTMLAKVL